MCRNTDTNTAKNQYKIFQLLNEIERLKNVPSFLKFSFLSLLLSFLSFPLPPPFSPLPFLLSRSLSKAFSFQAVLGYLFFFFEPLGASQHGKRPISKTVPTRSEYSSLVGRLFPVPSLWLRLPGEKSVPFGPLLIGLFRRAAARASPAPYWGQAPSPPKKKSSMSSSFFREAAHANDQFA